MKLPQLTVMLSPWM